MDKKSVKIGAGWRAEGKTGDYISVKLNNEKHFAIFKNEGKKEEKHPDYRLVMDWESAEEMGLISEYDIKKAAEEAEEEGVDGIKTNQIDL